MDEAAVPVTFAHAREMAPSAMLNFFTNLTRSFPFREVRQGALAPALIVREPVGVVAAVVPFNGPLMSATAKVAPVLAAGCPVVFKAATETPLDAFVLAEAAQAAGIPPGVVNILPGDAEVGAAWWHMPTSTASSLPGAPEPVSQIAQACAGSFKRVTLELGGKAAAIILDDAPIEESLASILPMSMFNSGQACIALSRILAPRRRYAEVVDAAVSLLQNHDPGTTRTSPPPCSAR